jgi:hypothetical protein
LVPFYGVLAVLLFLGSYGWDVVAALFYAVVFTETTRLRQRRAAVAHEVLGNPVAAGLVFSSLASQDGDERRLARRVLRRFGDGVSPDLLIGRLAAGERAGLPLVVRALQRVKRDDAGTTPRLEALWRGADTALRPVIIRILSGRPDQRSIDALGRIGKEMEAARVNAALAQVRFKLAVLPVYVWVMVLLALPPAIVLARHGWNVLTNPGWSQVLVLGRRSFTVEEDEQITAAAILKDHYATGRYAARIADALLRLLKNRTHSSRPAVHGAVVSAVVAIYDRSAVDDARLTAIRDQLVAEAGDLRRWLDAESRYYQPGPDDSLATGGPVGALRNMAAARDTLLANTAIRALRGFVLAPGDSDTAQAWKDPAIRALGTIPYARALPALDTLDRELNCAPDRAGLCEKIRSQMDSVIGDVLGWLYAASRSGDCASEAPRLLSIMKQLRYGSAQLEEAKREAARSPGDRNGDGVCDRADVALRLIDDSPDAEDGYLSLREYYVDQGLFQDAASAQRELKDKYRGSLWPRKILANIYHEYLSAQDTTFFRRSYEEMADLRRLPAFLALARTSDAWLRIESDYAEIALSARRYRELETSAGAVLAATDDAVYRFNLPLFLYMAQVLKGNADSAGAALDSLESVVHSLPAGFYNGWMYPGTQEFIRRSDLPDDVKGALLGLCREGFWPEGAEMDSVLAANRSALGALPRRDN